MHKIIIAGGRNFENYQLLKLQCDAILSRLRSEGSEIQIVSGGANGADKLGERYAQERKFIVKIFEANWDIDGKAAGPIRNKLMAEYGTHLIAFWDGKSMGTDNMIRQASFL